MVREIAKSWPHAELMDTWTWFQSGLNTDGAHNPVTSRRVGKGEILSLNCFPMVAGYYVALERTLFAETAGSFTNSGRVIQWRWKSVDGPGDAKDDTEIMATLFLKLKELYAKDGGAFSEPIQKLSWAYRIPTKPSPEELMMEYNGKALADVLDPKDPSKVLVKAGDQLPGFAMLRDDGSTSCGNWIYCGVWSQAGNLSARRDNSDPSGLGQTLNWGFAWPVNRRIIYNRASCDRQGKPFDPDRVLVQWNGSRWVGADVPDVGPTLDPETVNPFIMNPEGVARFFSRKGMNEGPFPTHYEAFDNPLGYNPMYPENKLAVISPAARILESAKGTAGDPKEFPHVGTSYRLTEHFHYWTKHVHLNNIVQPEQFVEIGEALAKELGIETGQQVKVSSKRGFVKAAAVVTKRIKPMQIDGKTIHHVGVPIHWGFASQGRKGHMANNLTASVGDGNSFTPESKTFLVKVEKV